MVGEFTKQAQHHDLAGAGVAPNPDLGVQPWFIRAAVTGQHGDHTAGMFPAGVVRCLDGVFKDFLGVRRDDERQHPAHRHRATLFAQPDDLLVDVVRRGARQVDDHGRLHSRPIRPIISNAEAGPQVPDSYGSGLPWSAQ